MAKIELKVADPKTLDKGIGVQRVQMTYGDTDSPIVLDTETAFFECEDQNKSAAAMNWMVDFSQHRMKVANDFPEGDYHKIDLSTAISMVGQNLQEAGISVLRRFLNTIPKEDRNPPPEPDDDIPDEKDPDFPDPFDEV